MNQSEECRVRELRALPAGNRSVFPFVLPAGNRSTFASKSAMMLCESTEAKPENVDGGHCDPLRRLPVGRSVD